MFHHQVAGFCVLISPRHLVVAPRLNSPPDLRVAQLNTAVTCIMYERSRIASEGGGGGALTVPGWENDSIFRPLSLLSVQKDIVSAHLFPMVKRKGGVSGWRRGGGEVSSGDSDPLCQGHQEYCPLSHLTS